jgi:hypothetical protein
MNNWFVAVNLAGSWQGLEDTITLAGSDYSAGAWTYT